MTQITKLAWQEDGEGIGVSGKQGKTFVGETHYLNKNKVY